MKEKLWHSRAVSKLEWFYDLFQTHLRTDFGLSFILEAENAMAGETLRFDLNLIISFMWTDPRMFIRS